jgi:hypothetical protein
MGFWVQNLGFVLLVAGVLLWGLSLAQVEPGRMWSVVSRGWFQEASDYSELGWKAWRLAWLLEIVAFVLLFASVYLFGYG